MSTTLDCPGCGLPMQSDCTSETLKCPRCLTCFPNPLAPHASGVQAEVALNRSPAVTGTQPTRPEQTPHLAEGDVNRFRDGRSVNVIVIVLAVIGGMGIACAGLDRLSSAWIFARHFSLKEGITVLASDPKTELFLGMLLVSTLISAGWVYNHLRPGMDHSNLKRTVLGALAISGVAVLGWLGWLIFFVIALCTSGWH